MKVLYVGLVFSMACLWRAVMGDKVYDALKRKGYYRGLGVPISGRLGEGAADVDGTVDEESVNRVLEDIEDNSNHYVIQVYGGNGCNGPPLEQIIVKADTCLGFYDMLPDGVGTPNIPFSPVNNEFKIVKEGESLIKEWYDYGEGLTKCRQPEKDSEVNEEDYVQKIMEYYYGDNSATLYESVNDIPRPEIGYCTDFKVDSKEWKFQNLNSRLLFASVFVENLGKLLEESSDPRWAPSAENMALHPSLSQGAGYIGSAGFDANRESGIFYYKPAEVGSCISRSGNIDTNAATISDPARNPFDGAREYMINSDLSGFAGPYGIYSGNSDLFPTASNQQNYQSLRLQCTADGGWKVLYYKEASCQSDIWTATYTGALRRSYIHGAGLANHAWFDDERPADGASNAWDSDKDVSIWHKIQCSGSGLPAYPVPGMMGANPSTPSVLSKTWSYARFFTESNCKGAVYAQDSLNAGKLLQCMPDPDSVPEGKDYMTGSFLIECLDISRMYGPDSPKDSEPGGNLRGFYKRFFDDMECKSETQNIPPTTRPVYGQPDGRSKSFKWYNPYVSNGDCQENENGLVQENGQTDDGDDNFLGNYMNEYQAKSFQYVCGTAPPQGMGYTVSRYSKPDCSGILTWAKSFDIKLGSNDSSPGAKDDALPAHAAYAVASKCLDNGALRTTWSAKDVDKVEILTYSSTVPKTCVENPSRAQNENSPMKDSHMYMCSSPPAKPPAHRLSEGEIAGIAIGCTFAVLASLGALFYFLVYAPIKQKEQVIPPSLFAESISVGGEADPVPPESTEYDTGNAGSLEYNYPDAGTGGADHMNPMWDTTGNASL